jgi:hypothetical protein
MAFQIRITYILDILNKTECSHTMAQNIINKINSNMLLMPYSSDISKTIREGDKIRIYIKIEQYSQLEVDLIVIQELCNFYNIDYLDAINTKAKQQLQMILSSGYDENKKIKSIINLSKIYAEEIELKELEGQLMCLCYLNATNQTNLSLLTESSRNYYITLIETARTNNMSKYYSYQKIPQTIEEIYDLFQHDKNKLNVYMLRILNILDTV